jgi:hypothetical protein
MKMEQRQSGDSGAEVKTGSVVMRRGEMERGSSGDRRGPLSGGRG